MHCIIDEIRFCGVLQDVKSGNRTAWFGCPWTVAAYRSTEDWRSHGTTSAGTDILRRYAHPTVCLCMSLLPHQHLLPPLRTLCRIISGIRTLLQPTLIACWKRFCFQHSGAISALDVLQRCALQIYILHTYFYLLFATPLLSLDYGPPLLILAQPHIQKTTNLFYLRSP